MFDFLKSLFGSEKETEKSVEFVETNNIIPNILAKKGLQYSNIQSGYQIKLKDGYYLVIPFIIDKNTYFYLQKGLKDKDDNEIKCTYFFKIIEKNDETDIIFVNRIKILNDNIKCDENYSRISKDILLEISDIVNEIVNNTPRIHLTRKIEEIEEETAEPIQENKQSGKSNSFLPFVLGATTAAAATAILVSTEGNIMRGGNINGEGKEKINDKKMDEKQYNNLRKLLEESISE
jgi:hypothetical protein